VYKDGLRFFTPLFLVFVLIAVTDVIFAVDSIPAIFAITEDPFIVMTSNIFAILGLRAMYVMLAGAAERFHLLSYGLAFILMFVGVKMLIVDWYKIPVAWSLAFVFLTLFATIVLSWLTSQRKPS
jgi:tellurite resistance protein TerC